ncbi:FixH family protein [Sulfitobacter sp. D35]|uniref:FixH family protein n=1 Tax=Sulfitobacter sp. D35 TaxID=3083252 RepID=UPI00296F425E|nr:FixH family protein [Sulfitobacter sp. D35]MDW4498566.1 FixH family protein [Sulfitobacter sp. D35]
MTREIKGWHVFTCFAVAFGIIIAVNLVLAVNAVRTFPGLETANSYVASQRFEADRDAQDALNWDVSAQVSGGKLYLRVIEDGAPVSPEIESAVFGRATSVARDQTPDFRWTGDALVADVAAGPGNWNLRLEARAADGTLFKQRVIVKVAE